MRRRASFAIAADAGRLDSALAPLASDAVTTIVGFTELADGGRLYNSAALFQRGSVAGLHRKLYPAINRSVYEAGRKVPVFQVEELTLGIVICNDSNYFEPARLMAAHGATALFVPANNGLPPARDCATAERRSNSRGDRHRASCTTPRMGCVTQSRRHGRVRNARSSVCDRGSDLTRPPSGGATDRRRVPSHAAAFTIPLGWFVGLPSTCGRSVSQAYAVGVTPICLSSPDLIDNRVRRGLDFPADRLHFPHFFDGAAETFPPDAAPHRAAAGHLIRAAHRIIVDRRSARLQLARRLECALVVLDSRFAAFPARAGTHARLCDVLGSFTPVAASE